MSAADGQLWLFDAPAPAAIAGGEPELVELGDHCQASEAAIRASSSCGTICSEGRVRNPFRFRGADWVCTGSSHFRDEQAFDCYRVVDVAAFAGPGELASYGEHDFFGDRRPAFGGYHGMTARLGRRTIALEGPPIIFATAAELRARQAKAAK